MINIFTFNKTNEKSHGHHICCVIREVNHNKCNIDMHAPSVDSMCTVSHYKLINFLAFSSRSDTKSPYFRVKTSR